MVDYHVIESTTGLPSRSAREIIFGPNYCHRAEQIAIEVPRATLISSTSRLRALELELGPVP